MEDFRQLLSPELQLIALLSRPELTNKQVSEAHTLLQQNLDYDLLKTLLDQHRVWPCVYLNVQSHFENRFHGETFAYLHKKYLQNVSLHKRQFQILTKLIYQFNSAGIPVASIKGCLLAKKLYGDIAKRHSSDIDLVTRREYLEKADKILNQLGFSCDAYNKLTPKQLIIYFGRQKDLSYWNKDGILIELHIRLFEHKSPLSEKIIGDLLITDTTKSNSEYEFIYLCQHGAHNFHYRLKWLLDIALFIETKTKEEKNFHKRVWSLSDQFNAKRYIAISWVLASILYEIEVPKLILDFCASDKTTIMLIEKSIFRIKGNDATSTLKFWLFTRMRGLIFPEKLHQKLFTLNDMLFSPCGVDLIKMSKIPDSFAFFHYFLRPFFVVWRVLKEIKQR
ncbi:nucleotidyltransferase family protein [Aliikangiella coralliicola]|uniref:nucleotidyltransferase family protein n=1 Tax=Aliikangiella coralliicola TaxID=2592383 RepID=UPI00143DAC8F|nr:nucleotidyltransferase family protein [Aliikangiella coralliicola]